MKSARMKIDLEEEIEELELQIESLEEEFEGDVFDKAEDLCRHLKQLSILDHIL